MGLLSVLQNPTDSQLLAVGFSQGSTPGSVLIVDSINDLENGTEHTPHNFKDVNRLGGNIQMLGSSYYSKTALQANIENILLRVAKGWDEKQWPQAAARKILIGCEGGKKGT